MSFLINNPIVRLFYSAQSKEKENRHELQAPAPSPLSSVAKYEALPARADDHIQRTIDAKNNKSAYVQAGSELFGSNFIYRWPRRRSEDAGQLTQCKPHLEGVDPLISSWVHNHRSSPLYRLPNDVLLRMIGVLSREDIVALLCLRLVSGRFYQLVHEQLFRELDMDMMGRNHLLLLDDARLDHTTNRRYQAHICAEEFCAACLAVFKSTGSPAREWSMRRYCRVDASDDVLYCDGCACLQPAYSFSPAQRLAPAVNRTCIGREARFRLCEHRNVRWAEIEKELAIWDRAGTQRSLLTVLCDDSSHGYCAASPDSGGIVQLECLAKPETGEFELQLKLRAHKLLDCDRQGRPEARQIRSMFGEVRRTARWLQVLPESNTPGSADPEMACFDPTVCTCLRYGGSEDLEKEWRAMWPKASELRRLGKHARLTEVAQAAGEHQATINAALKVTVTRCDAHVLVPEHEGKRCVVVEYSRALRFGERCYLGGRRHNPFHAWLHLAGSDPDPPAVARCLDVETGVSWPGCPEPTCVHYSRLSHCPAVRRSLRKGSLADHFRVLQAENPQVPDLDVFRRCFTDHM